MESRKVTCPKCGHVFEPYALEAGDDVVTPMHIVPIDHPVEAGDRLVATIPLSVLKNIQADYYVTTYGVRRYRLECGHDLVVEFARYEKGQKAYCRTCDKEVAVVSGPET